MSRRESSCKNCIGDCPEPPQTFLTTTCQEHPGTSGARGLKPNPGQAGYWGCATWFCDDSGHSCFNHRPSAKVRPFMQSRSIVWYYQDLVLDSFDYQMFLSRGCNAHVGKPQMLHANLLLPVKTSNTNNQRAISFLVRTLSILLVWLKFVIQRICHEVGNYSPFTAVLINKTDNALFCMVQHPAARGLVTKFIIVN